MSLIVPSSIRVAMLGPISWRTPPRHYGPWELFVSMLTEGLVERGVDVTLFATADSVTKARLIATAARGYSEDPDIEPKVWEGLHISAVFERAGDFDLIHNSFDYLPLTFSQLVDTPVLTTIHGFSSERILPVYEKYNGCGYYVSISDADRSEKLDYITTVHHGIVLDDFDLKAEPGDYLLFYGRIHHEKGTAEAIRVAHSSGLPLVIAGIIQDQAYFDAKVAPHLDGESVRYVGPVGSERRSELLGGARALLHLINFDEPFGLSVVEAMACGTPVVAIERGSMPELIEHGVDGFLVDATDGADAAVAAVEAASRLDRRRVRRTIEDRFTRDRMVDDYIAVYQRVLEFGATGTRRR
jgi:glycosyltransferase involved in cell wall biosynthesis